MTEALVSEPAPAWALPVLRGAGWAEVPGHPDLWKRNGEVNSWREALALSVQPPPPKPGWRSSEFLLAAGAAVALVPAATWEDLWGALAEVDPSLAKLAKALGSVGLAVVVGWYAQRRAAAKQTTNGGTP